jgi:hypothetical protein
LVLIELLMIAAAFGLAALPIGRRPVADGRTGLRYLVPDVRQPSSMLSFVALPSFLILVTLVRLGVFLEAVDQVNRPNSNRRLAYAPRDVEIDFKLVDGEWQLRYPRNTAELAAAAASRADAGSKGERVQGIRDLAWWTGVCPGYATFALPRLARALQDPDPSIKGAAAIGLGSTGSYGAPALPALLAARGTSVRYLDHLIAEAVLLIHTTPPWSPATECQDASATQLEVMSRPTRG